MGRELDYRYVNTMSIMTKVAPVLTDKIAPIMQEVWNDEAELLSGVPESVKEGMRSDFLSFERMMEIGGKVTTADGYNDYEPVEEYINIIEKLKFDKLLEQYKKETFHECVHTENYQKLSELAEYVKQLKIQTKYVVTEAKERQINASIVDKEKAFEADYKSVSLSENELNPVNLDEKIADYKSKKEKAENYIVSAEKEKEKSAENIKSAEAELEEAKQDVEIAKKRLENEEKTKELYEELEKIHEKRVKLATQMAELEADKKRYDETASYKAVDKEYDKLTKKNDELEEAHQRLEETFEPIMSELRDMLRAKAEMVISARNTQEEKARQKYIEAYEKYEKAAKEHGIAPGLSTTWENHQQEYRAFKSSYETTKNNLWQERTRLSQEHFALQANALKYENCVLDLDLLRLNRTSLLTDLKALEVDTAGYDNIEQFLDGLKHYCENVDFEELKANVDACEKRLESLNTTIETSKKAIETADKTVETSKKAIEMLDEKLEKAEKFKDKVETMGTRYLNNRVDDAMALQEIIENRKEYWNAMVDQFKDFNNTILDGSKSKDQKNSNEFERMKTALEKMTGLKNRNAETYKEALEEVKASAQAYLDAKNQQIRLLPSTQRKTRMQFTKDLIARCELVEKMDYKCVEFGTQKDVIALQNRAVKFSGANKEAAGIRKSDTPEYKATAKKVFAKFYKDVENRMKKETPAPQKEEVKTVEKKEPVKEAKTLQTPGLN